MSNFQTILLVIFGVFIVLGVLVFSLYRGSGGVSDVTVTIWGDISSHEFNDLLKLQSLKQEEIPNIRYVEKSTENIDAEFTEALARGIGPDLIIISQDRFLENKPKLSVIPYGSISERDFKATYIEEGELFLDQTGIYALPLSIDPLVLYYNRDALSSAGLAQPISYWDEIYAVAQNLSKKDPAGNIISSVMALGEAKNIPHAKDILSLLFLQAGTPITGFVGDDLRAQISYNSGLPTVPAVSALDFYTQFSNPTKTYYSWNRSLIDALTHFTAGDSAYYLGFVSEYRIIKNKNPNLNFGVSPVPQSRVSGKTTTFGQMKAVAISRGSKNPTAAFIVATKLASKELTSALSSILVLPPPRRDLLSIRPTDALWPVFYDAALQSNGWLDPNRLATKVIFQEAIESVTSGRARTTEAINEANKKVEALIK